MRKLLFFFCFIVLFSFSVSAIDYIRDNSNWVFANAYSDTLARGAYVGAKYDITVWGIYYNSAKCTATQALIYNSSYNFIGNGTCSAGTCIMNQPIILKQGVDYYVMVGNYGNSFTADYGTSQAVETNGVNTIIHYGGSWNYASTFTKDTGYFHCFTGINTTNGTFLFVPPTPDNGTHSSSTNVLLNLSCPPLQNATIWFDSNINPMTMILNNNATGYVNISSYVGAEGAYYYKGSCDNGTTVNSTVFTWFYDVSEPTITINPNNFFESDNSTNLSRASSSTYLNITLTDNILLYGVMINITNSSGDSHYYYSNESLTGTSATIYNYVNVSSWELGNYTVEITGTDAHTIASIDDYDVTAKNRELSFSTEEGNSIQVKTNEDASLSATKINDRYKFDVTFTSKAISDKSFEIYSDKPIRYMKDSPYKAHLVVWNKATKKGNWIDFEGAYGIPIVTKVTDYHYTVMYKGVGDKFSFNSIGGLNTNTEWYAFEILTIYPVNPAIWLGNKLMWNYTGEIEKMNASLNVSYLNQLISDGCVCEGCTLSGTDCIFDFKFYSEEDSNMRVTFYNKTQKYGIDNCSNTENIPSNFTAYNISFFNMDGSRQATPYSTTISYGGSSSYGESTSFSATRQNFSYCIYPSWAELYAEIFIEYSNNSYADTGLLFSDNATQIINLYLQTDTTPVVFKVVDYGTNPVADAYIYIQKWDSATNSYLATETLKTDSNGEAIGNIVLLTQFYKFIIVYNGETKLVDPTTQGVKLYTNTRTFKISTGIQEWFEHYDDAFKVGGDVTFNNASKSFTFTWLDADSNMDYGCLKVTQKNSSGSYTLSDNCVASVTATIVYTITPFNGSSYTGIGYMMIGDDIIVIDTETVSFKEQFQKLKDTGKSKEALFFAMLLVLSLTLLGLPYPDISFILFIVGIVFTSILGLWQISMGMIIGIIVLGGIHMYLGNKK